MSTDKATMEDVINQLESDISSLQETVNAADNLRCSGQKAGPFTHSVLLKKTAEIEGEAAELREIANTMFL